MWLLVKALNANMSITDRSLYELNNVFYINNGGKKPSLSTFSKIYELGKHKSIKKKPLAGIDCKEMFKNYQGDFDSLNLDSLVTNHLNEFWSHYNISFQYNIEHKPDHLSIKTSYLKKGNYALKTYNPNEKNWTGRVFKIRGQKEFCNDVKNPIFVFFENILNNEDEFPQNLDYKHSSLLKLKTWLQKNNLNKEFDIRPGEVLVSDRKWRLNNSFMPFNYESAYNASIRMRNKKDFVGFERFSDKGIDVIH